MDFTKMFAEVLLMSQSGTNVCIRMINESTKAINIIGGYPNKKQNNMDNSNICIPS